MEKIFMTREGLTKMENDLHRMQTEDVKECLGAISDARDKGNITENGEFETARRVYEELMAKIQKLSTMLTNSVIIDSAIDDGTVQLLTTVKIKDIKTKKITEYKLVPENEADVKNGKISGTSPIGKSLMGKKVGDKVKVIVPIGEIDLQIMKVNV